jgi:low affinity Fe/Cu permease
MNTVVFAIAIGVATLLTFFLLQKVLDNPNT